MRSLIGISLIILSCVLNSLPAQTLHLFLLGSFQDEKISQNVEKSLKNIEDSFSYLASVSGVQLSVIKIPNKSKLLTQRSVEAAIRKKSIGRNDIVILYYHGHGGRMHDSPTIWPFGCFDDGYVEFAEILEKLFPKKRSFVYRYL